MDELDGPSGSFDWVRAQVAHRVGSEFRKNILWSASLGGFERGAAVAQAVLISRALGITEYGAFGLLLGTIGFVASVVGFQMALTAAVFVSKYRHHEKAKAAGVISTARRFSLGAALTFMVVALPLSGYLAEVLMGSGNYQVAVMLGVVFVGVSVLGDVQDGVAQGFEIFETLARVKAATAVVVLASIYPTSTMFGLNGALACIIVGPVLKYVVLQAAILQCRTRDGLPPVGTGVPLVVLLREFALPSMAVSLLLGLVMWLGLYLLSTQDAGLDGVAAAVTGLQWRGPLLLLAASFGAVAVPAFSRLTASGDAGGSRRLRRKLATLNFVIASVVAVAVVAASGPILSLYGADFVARRLAFILAVLSAVPAVVANVYLQELVGAARMWRQFWLYCPYWAVLCGSFVWLVPRYHAAGYGGSLLIGSLVLWAQVAAAEWLSTRRSALQARSEA